MSPAVCLLREYRSPLEVVGITVEVLYQFSELRYLVGQLLLNRLTDFMGQQFELKNVKTGDLHRGPRGQLTSNHGLTQALQAEGGQ